MFTDDGEEEFYYSEVEIPSTAPRTRAYTEPASQMANLSLADHLDMARPAHEDPGIPKIFLRHIQYNILSKILKKHRLEYKHLDPK